MRATFGPIGSDTQGVRNRPGVREKSPPFSTRKPASGQSPIAAVWIATTQILLGVAVQLHAEAAHADNPIIQTKFTADPAPLVHDDTVYLYTSHDEDSADGFTMYNWLLYSSSDLVNWRDHGVIGGVKEPNKTFKWADGVNAWAPQVIARNDKFYMYAPFPKGGHMVIGVAVADQPTGPFVDALGAPLINNPNSSNDIDPTVFIDTDEQAYLYWGHQPSVFYVKLKPDMISYSGSIVQVTRPDTFEEGPWFYRRNDNYYLAFASTCCPEGIGYAMSSSPTGPWTFKGSVMDRNSASSGNHPGIIDYKGNSYVFGFNYFLNNNVAKGVHHERRSINLAQFSYNSDGSIPKLPWWTLTGVTQIGHLNPYVRTEAETIAFEAGPGSVPCKSPTDYECWTAGVKTEVCTDAGGGMDVTNIQNGSYIKVQGVDFGAGASSVDVRVAAGMSGGKIELRLDSPSGTLAGTCSVPSTGGLQTWATQTCEIAGATAVHDLFFVFRGGSGNLYNFNWWQFHGAGVDPGNGSGGSPAAAGGAPGSGGATTGVGGAVAGGSLAGGSAGSPTVSSGGSASGGASNSGGNGLGGALAGGMGTGGRGAGGSAAGSTGVGGQVAAGGSDTTDGNTSGSRGCSCELGRRVEGASGLSGLALSLAALGYRRRQRRSYNR